MADVKISDLSAGTPPYGDATLFEIEAAATSYKAQLADLLQGSAPAYSAPTTGATVTTGSLERRRIIDPAAAIAALTIVLPPSPSDGWEWRGLTSQTITTVAVNGAGAETVTGGTFTLVANGTVRFVYRAANTTWYRG